MIYNNVDSNNSNWGGMTVEQTEPDWEFPFVTFQKFVSQGDINLLKAQLSEINKQIRQKEQTFKEQEKNPNYSRAKELFDKGYRLYYEYPLCGKPFGIPNYKTKVILKMNNTVVGNFTRDEYSDNSTREMFQESAIILNAPIMVSVYLFCLSL